MIVIPRIGAAAMLALIFHKAEAEDMVMRLFQNDFTPDKSTTLGDLVEIGFPGYTPMIIDPVDVTITSDPPQSVAQTGVYEFTASAPASVNAFGWYVTGSSSGALYYLERFVDPPAPWPFVNAGDKARIFIDLSLFDPT